jgi:hypothetical protein
MSQLAVELIHTNIARIPTLLRHFSLFLKDNY